MLSALKAELVAQGDARRCTQLALGRTAAAGQGHADQEEAKLPFT